MIVVRNVFRLKYGQMRPALALWAQSRELLRNLGQGAPRVLTDLVGPAYTLVLESTHRDIAEFERETKATMAQPEWQAWYQKFTPLVESGYREIFSIVE